MLLFIYRRHHLLLCCGALLLSLQCLLQHTSYAFAPPPSIAVNHHFQKRTHTNLFATNNDKPSTSKSARERGIYSRPSAAIERGSGFFIPGLEGPRIRILFGMTVLLANGANHLFAESEVGDLGQLVAEVLAAGYGMFLLLQGLIESGVGFANNSSSRGSEDLIVESDGDNNAVVGLDSSTAVVVSNNNGFSPAIEGDQFAMKSIQRLAQTIVSLTPATHFLLANEEDGILYRYGIWDGGNNSLGNKDDYTTIIKTALDATGSSRAGRVALPSEHPVSNLLPTSATRCILVQSIDGFGSGGKSCLIIGSDKLLPAYTKNDLRWIGQLAVEPKM